MSYRHKVTTGEDDAIRAMIAKLTLEECKVGVLKWFYISLANEKEFLGGYILQAFGPTHAWVTLHALGWYPSGSDAGTETTLVPGDVIEVMDPSVLWRKLSKEEVGSLGECGEIKKPRPRTESEIMAARRKFPHTGCCERYANNQACDCLTNAIRDPK